MTGVPSVQILNNVGSVIGQATEVVSFNGLTLVLAVSAVYDSTCSIRWNEGAQPVVGFRGGRVAPMTQRVLGAGVVPTGATLLAGHYESPEGVTAYVRLEAVVPSPVVPTNVGATGFTVFANGCFFRMLDEGPNVTGETRLGVHYLILLLTRESGDAAGPHWSNFTAGIEDVLLESGAVVANFNNVAVTPLATYLPDLAFWDSGQEVQLHMGGSVVIDSGAAAGAFTYVNASGDGFVNDTNPEWSFDILAIFTINAGTLPNPTATMSWSNTSGFYVRADGKCMASLVNFPVAE